MLSPEGHLECTVLVRKASDNNSSDWLLGLGPGGSQSCVF